LQEVEAAIAALPGVAQAVTAIVRSPAAQQDYLAAWVSPASLNPQDLLSDLAGSLPVYMIPTVVVPLAALPLLPSEKVNRKALPAPDWSKHLVAAAAGAGASKAAFSAAGGVTAAKEAAAAAVQSDPLMLFLQGLWAEVLHEPSANITPSSDFFSLGGTSLLVGVMNSRLRAHTAHTVGCEPTQ
jgi:hypothetical protein